MRRIILSFACLFCLSMFAIAQHHGHDHSGHNHDHSGHGHDHGSHATEAAHSDGHSDGAHGDHGCVCHHEIKPGDKHDPGKVAFHHVSDQNVYNIGPLQLPLPVIAYATDGAGWTMFSSGYFEADAHGNSCKAKDKYVLVGGILRRVPALPMGELTFGGLRHKKVKNSKGKEKDRPFVCYNGKEIEVEDKSTADFGAFGPGITTFFDFSITKNVTAMFIVCFLLGLLFLRLAKTYREREGQAPTGIQNFMEVLYTFIQDEVAKPFIGHKYLSYQPFLMALFFFILGLNLFGQIPFFGNANVTGSLAVTMVLAVCTFLVTNFNGNKHYWEHTLWMPGVPAWLKMTILTPVEVMGLIIKPLTLMLRLFANITAGHMVIAIFVGLIFLFGQSGLNAGASYGTSIASGVLTLFMMAIELLVAFIQAFVFTILTASYVGAAVEDAHH